MDKLTDAFVAVVTIIAAVAMLAVLVGKNSQTASVAKSAFDGATSLLKEAVSPVAGF